MSRWASGYERPGILSFVEATEKTGKLWEIVIIEAGLSKNGRVYPPEVLQKAAPLFEDCNVYVHTFDGNESKHLPEKVRAAFPAGVAGNLVGWLDNIRFKEVDGTKALVGDLHVVSDWLRETFKSLWEEGRSDKLGFSIDVEGMISDGILDGQSVKQVESIDKVYATDVVTHPAAGGRTNRLLASHLEEATRLGDFIRSRREELEVDPDRLARAMGISPNTLANIETGDIKRPPDERLRGAARVLKVSFDKLLQLIPEEKRAQEATMKGMIAFLKKHSPAILEGVDLTKMTEADVAGFLQKAVEAIKAKLTPAQENIGDDLAMVMELMKAGKIEEAMAKLSAAMELMAKAVASEEKKTEEPVKPPEPAKPAESAKPAAPAAGPDKSAEAIADLKKRQDASEKKIQEGQVRESSAIVRAKLAESNLPTLAKEKISAEFTGQVITESDVSKRISDETSYLAKMSESGNVHGLGGSDGFGVSMGRSSLDRMTAAMSLALGYKPEKGEEKEFEGVKRFRSLREAYKTITGDDEVRWSRRTLTPRIAEAISSDFPKVLGDSITRRLLQAYRAFPKNWDKLTGEVLELDSFRTQRPIQWGSFGDLAIVAEDAAFTALANPTEKEAPYSAQKRGKTFAITREMILADDLRKLRQIPVLMARAANRTLEKFVHNILIGNVGGGGINSDVIYDGAVLYFAGKNNLATDALDSASLRAALIRVRKQQDEDSNETLGLRAKYLWVPLELEATAKVLVASELLPGSPNNDINDNKDMVIPVGSPYLGGDINNWYLSVAPEDLQGIELGFVGGQMEPEVLVQDDPATGDVFTNERITYKVRHEYGGAIVDFRSFDGSIVV